jgi:RNA polymerase sigma factor (sigma-70 family)
MVAPADRPSADAFEAIYRKYYPDVYRYALLHSGNPHDAEDITGDTFERAFRAWEGTTPAQPPLPWLLLTARRLSADRWRRAARFVLHRLGVRHEITNDFDDVEASHWLASISQILPARQREVLLLRYQRDISDEDIAALMDLTPSGVRSLVARALTKLRAHPEVWK